MLGTIAAPCTCTISDADTSLIGTVRNSSTREVLDLLPNGPFVITWLATTPCGYMYFHGFSVRDSSSLYGDTDKMGSDNCTLSVDADTLYYAAMRGDSALTIMAVRQ
jgi:hypothetical protein